MIDWLVGDLLMIMCLMSGDRGRETKVVKRRRYQAVDTVTAATQTTPGLDRRQ